MSKRRDLSSFCKAINPTNITRIANAVQCHSLLSSHNGCNVFLNVRNVYNFTNVTSIFDGSLKVFSKCQVIFSPHSDLIKSKSKVTSSLKDYSLMIFSKCLVLVGQQMSQRSQLFRISLRVPKSEVTN